MKKSRPKYNVEDIRRLALLATEFKHAVQARYDADPVLRNLAEYTLTRAEKKDFRDAAIRLAAESLPAGFMAKLGNEFRNADGLFLLSTLDVCNWHARLGKRVFEGRDDLMEGFPADLQTEEAQTTLDELGFKDLAALCERARGHKPNLN